MKRLWPIIGLVILVAILSREILPKHVRDPAPPPIITTVHDTIHDTLRIRVPKPVPGPTLTIRETIHDTTFIQIGPAPEQRTNIWPVLTVDVGKKVGDTTRITTFSLRSGQGASSQIYTGGPLLGVWADSVGTPRVLFGTPPQPASVSFWTKVKWGGLGYASCEVVNGLARLVAPK